MKTVFLFFVYVISAQGERCLVDDISVQPNFDINKFKGRWYEISWVRYYFEPPYDNYLDYTQSYRVVDNRLVEGVTAGRPSRDAEYCINNTETFHVSPMQPAKWTFDMVVNKTVLTLDHWIIATDYDNYAFVYGCTRRNDDGTCRNAHAWKWSRSRTLSEDHSRLMADVATDVCVNNSYFTTSQQSRDCWLPTVDACAVITGAWLVVLLPTWTMVL